MTKKDAKDLAKYYGCKTAYSGKTRTMYIKGDNHKEAITAIKAHHVAFDVRD